MLQVGISRDEAIQSYKKDEILIVDHINVITVELLLPRDALKGDFQNFSQFQYFTS